MDELSAKCQQLRNQYQRIALDSSNINLNSQSDHDTLEFLDIPMTGGSATIGSSLKLFSNHDRKKELRSGELCYGSGDRSQESLCKCSPHHIPPRYVIEESRKGRAVFCVTRSPLARLLNEYRINHHGGRHNNIRAVEQWVMDLISKLSMNAAKSSISLDSDSDGKMRCHSIPQYEYIWDEKGKRTCDYILRYEDDLETDFNSLMTSFNRSDINLLKRAISSPIIDLLIKDISSEVLAAVHDFYWKDYCLLGYDEFGKLTQYSTGASALSDRSNQASGLQDTSRKSSYHASLNRLNTGIQAVSPQVLEASDWGSINETFVPSSLTFNQYGLPNRRACQEYASMYELSELQYLFQHPPPRKGNAAQVYFLHIPKTGGKSVETIFPHVEKGRFWNYWKKKKQVRLGERCSSDNTDSDVQSQGSTCQCSFWHVPPRYLTPVSFYDGRIVMCVVRDPLDKALSKFKMNNAGRLTAENANNYIADHLSRLYELSGDEYCHLMAQYEYVWDENGRRTCHHVLRYESGLARGVNELMDAYGVKKNHMNESVVPGSVAMHHEATNLTVLDLDPELAIAVRKFYWRDYCLFGYYDNNPWITSDSSIDNGEVNTKTRRLADSDISVATIHPSLIKLWVKQPLNNNWKALSGFGLSLSGEYSKFGVESMMAVALLLLLSISLIYKIRCKKIRSVPPVAI